MAGFDSPIGRRDIKQTKTFEVEDPDLDEDIENQIREQRKLKAAGKERMTSNAKRRIELLLNMTVLTEEVTLGKVKFILRTLKAGEVKEILSVINPLRGSYEFELEMKRQMLARSLVKINDSEVESFLDSDTLDARLELVDSLESSVFTGLFLGYEKLQNNSEKYYGIANAENAKEVAEEIKK
jgi:hypothetical protein